MKNSIKMFAISACLCLAAVPAAHGESVLFHLKTGLSKDDAQICVAPNVALAALSKGDDVTMLVDASAAYSLRRSGFSRKTPLAKAALPQREVDALQRQFGIASGDLPRNYEAYFHFLKQRGVRLYVNKTMLSLAKIPSVDIDSDFQPLELSQMYELFKKANRVITY